MSKKPDRPILFAKLNQHINTSSLTKPMAPNPVPPNPSLSRSNHAPEHTHEDALALRRTVCATCGVAYVESQCPACASESKARQAIARATKLTKEVNRLRAQLDAVAAMTDALGDLGEEDRVRLKELLYGYREDPHRYTVGPLVERNRPTGFVQLTRDGRQVHERLVRMDSLGGIMLASEFEVACRAYKTQGATAMLLRAAGHLLEVNT